MTDTMTEDRTNVVGGIAADRLRSFVERIEREEEVKRGISDGIKEIYQSAKSDGFDVKAIREMVKLRKKDRETLQEDEHMRDLYKLAVGLD